ncbi:betaine-aldehyde dehydrogenase [Gordonia spumicola]|uniref:Betaine-aldehyde dehydrogenase n=1 Tax=Gordonia spumicola TaxID=589161 RepID=A0A7I9V345_9ACTN|nr:aldehyde dehydrogenase family protein [Gordonia spumicola]GED99824.1 betaine-aldehyde dehydrogenase [Gordonia spumicola]
MTTAFTRGPWTTLNLPTADQTFCVTGNGTLDSIDPTTGEVVATLSVSTTNAEVDQVVAAAHEAMASTPWRNDGARRARVLNRYAQGLRDNVDFLAELLTREQGKTIGEARTEVLSSAEMVEYYAGAARMLYGRAMALGDNAHAVILREPIGVVGVITPWNWPLLLMIRAIAPALAAGNAVVVKPASVTPAITVEGLAPLAADPELPAGIVSCVLGSGGIVGDAVVTNPGVDMIAFTGESSTGINVMKRAADDLRKVSLELGGKSPNIVFADADLDKALDGALNAAFSTSGQICTAGSRLLVEDSIYDTFMARLTERVEAFRIGDPLDPATTMAPVVSKSQQKSVTEYAEMGRDAGTVIAEATVPADAPDTSCYVAPIVIGDLASDSPVVQEEIFGPVLVVQRFADEAEAVEIAEDSEFGLAAGIWTSDLNRAWRMGRAVSAGSVWINTYHHFYAEAEVGGFKKSGLGRQQGVTGIEEFTETKHLNFDIADTLW